MPTEVQHRLIDILCQNCASSPTDEEAVLKRFGSILFDQIKLLESAIDVLDNDSFAVTKHLNEASGRIVWKVRGSHGNEYTCLNGFCSCPSYLQQVKQPQDGAATVLCKHMLAVRLAVCLNKFQLSPVNNDRFVELMCNTVYTTPNYGNNNMNHFGTASKWRR